VESGYGNLSGFFVVILDFTVMGILIDPIFAPHPRLAGFNVFIKFFMFSENCINE
jgi:hypothetical protein